MRRVLIEELPVSDDGYIKDSYQIKWTFANEVGLIFVVRIFGLSVAPLNVTRVVLIGHFWYLQIVYQKILQLAYIDELLEAFKRLFCSVFNAQVKDTDSLHVYAGFETQFDKLLGALEAEDLQVDKTRTSAFFLWDFASILKAGGFILEI